MQNDGRHCWSWPIAWRRSTARLVAADVFPLHKLLSMIGEVVRRPAFILSSIACVECLWVSGDGVGVRACMLAISSSGFFLCALVLPRRRVHIIAYASQPNYTHYHTHAASKLTSIPLPHCTQCRPSSDVYFSIRCVICATRVWERRIRNCVWVRGVEPFVHWHSQRTNNDAISHIKELR